MSLIKCPECEADISEEAKTCPKCGFNIPVEGKHVIAGTLAYIGVFLFIYGAWLSGEEANMGLMFWGFLITIIGGLLDRKKRQKGGHGKE